jgi:hypothetical protein
MHNWLRVPCKFEFLAKVYVYGKQFPFTIAYISTNNISQGRRLLCIADINNSVFFFHATKATLYQE